MQVPKITETHWIAASKKFHTGHTVMDVCNKAIEIALAEQSQEQPQPVELHAELKAMYEQQVKDGTLGNYYWQFKDSGGISWLPILTDLGKFHACNKYQCIPKETCQVRNEDTGELKTMTREAAQKLWDELGYTVEWFSGRFHTRFPADQILAFDDTKDGCHKGDPVIYTYKLKANMVKLNGKLVTREAAIAEWESKKETCDIYHKSANNRTWWHVGRAPAFDTHDNEGSFGEYELRERPLKQISWKDVPVGVAVLNHNGDVFNIVGHCGNNATVTGISKSLAYEYSYQELELAPADQQDWIAVRRNEDGIAIREKVVTAGLCIELHHTREKYRITGIAKGYSL